VIVVTRHRVAAGAGREFIDSAQAAMAVLSDARGFLDAAVGRATDDGELFTIVTRWADVGSYRRAVSGAAAKLTVVPLLSTAIDEPSAFEVLGSVGGPSAWPADGPSALAADAGWTRLGEAAAPVVATDLEI
jgi:quinol monooxygenase YgiN